MGVMEGLLGGFLDRKYDVEATKRREGEIATERERQVFSTLLQSDREDVRSLAIAGLLDSANPRRKASGLRGWIGETLSSPYLSQIDALRTEPSVEPETRMTLPGRAVTGGGTAPAIAPHTSVQQEITTPPSEAPAAGAATSPVRPGAEPPPQPLQYSQMTRSEEPTGQTVVGPPKPFFLSPIEKYQKEAVAKQKAEIQGDVEALKQYGYDDATAVKTAIDWRMRARMGSSVPYQSVPGEIPGPDGTPIPMYAAFDRTRGVYMDPDTHQPLVDFRRTDTSSSGRQFFGVDREALAWAKYHKKYGELSAPEASDILDQEKSMLEAEARRRALGSGMGKFESPLTPTQAQQTGLPAGTTGPEVVGQGVPTMQQQEQFRTMDFLQTELTHIKNDLLWVLPSAGETAGRLPGMAYALRRRDNRYRPDIGRLESAVNNIVNVMARVVGQQRGAQTEKDALRAEAAIVAMRDAIISGDTQESASARIEESLKVVQGLSALLPKQATPTATPTAPPLPGNLNAAPTAKKDANGNWVLP